MWGCKRTRRKTFREAYHNVTSSLAALLYAARIKNTAPLWRFMYSVHCATSNGIFFDDLICMAVSRGRDHVFDVHTCATLLQEGQPHSTLPLIPRTPRVHRGRRHQRWSPMLAYIERYPCFLYHRTALTIYTVIEDFSANCLWCPRYRGCRMTPFPPSSRRRRLCGSLDNTLRFVLKPGSDSLRDPAVNTNSKDGIDSYLV